MMVLLGSCIAYTTIMFVLSVLFFTTEVGKLKSMGLISTNRYFVATMLALLAIVGLLMTGLTVAVTPQ